MMKPIKRAAALILALVLCLGLMVTGASAEYADEAEIVNKEAVSTLEVLGVINGEKKPNGTSAFYPERIVTRAEMCKMICLVLNGGEEPVMGSPAQYAFSDIKGHWAADYIEFVAGLNIVNGLGDGTFAPNSPVTGQQAAKMLLVAMGYDAGYEQMVGSQWASRADGLANLNLLYDKLPASFLTTEALSRDDAAQMVYNALFCSMRYYISAGEHGVVGVQCRELYMDEADGIRIPYTVFRFYYDAFMLEGVVEKNSDGYVKPQIGKIMPPHVDPTLPAPTPGPTIMSTAHNEDGKTFANGWRNTAGLWFEDPTDVDYTNDELDFNTTGELLGMSVRYAYFTSTRAGITRQKIIGAPVATEFNNVIKITEPGVYTSEELGLKLNTLSGLSGNYTTHLLNNNFRAIFINSAFQVETMDADDLALLRRMLLLNDNGLYIAGNGYVSRLIDNNDDGEIDYINDIVTTPYKVESVEDGFVTLRDLTWRYDENRPSDGLLRADGIWDYLTEGCYTGDQNTDDVALIPLDRIVTADGEAVTVKKGDVLLAAVYGGRVNCFDYTTFTGKVDKIASRNFTEDGEEWNEKFITVDGETYAFHDSYPGTIMLAIPLERDLRLPLQWFGSYTAEAVHNGSGFAGKYNPLIELGANLKYYLDEAGYVFYAEEIEESYNTPGFALAIECDPIAQYSLGQPVRLVFEDGTAEDIIVGKIWTLDDGTGKFVCNKTSAAKGVWLNLTRYPSRTCMVSYLKEEDGTYTILPLGDSSGASTDGGGTAPGSVPGFEEIVRRNAATPAGGGWIGVVSGSTKIVAEWNNAPTVASYVPSTYTDSQTNFVNVRSNPIAYKGYSAVPSMDWTNADVYGVTDEMAARAYEIFNGIARKTAGNSRLVTDVFVMGASYLTGVLASAEYFYVPDKAEVSRSYYNGVLVDQFTAMVDGASKKIYIPVRPLDGGALTSETLEANTLYHIDVVGSKGIISDAAKITELTYLEVLSNGGVTATYADYTTVAYSADGGLTTTSLSLNGAKIIDTETDSLIGGTRIKTTSDVDADALYIIPSADGKSAKQIYVVHMPDYI